MLQQGIEVVSVADPVRYWVSKPPLQFARQGDWAAIRSARKKLNITDRRFKRIFRPQKVIKIWLLDAFCANTIIASKPVQSPPVIGWGEMTLVLALAQVFKVPGAGLIRHEIS